MQRIFHILEIAILTLTIISILFLTFVQIILPEDNNLISTVSKYHSEKKLVPINKISGEGKGIIVLKLLNFDLKDVEIIINGDIVNSFDEKDEISVEVYNNDVIEIDGTKYMDKVKVQVVGISKNIELPKLNAKVETSQSIEMLGRVKFK